MIDTVGILTYTTENGAYLEIDKNIGKYYRRLYRLSRWHTAKLLPPMRGSHVGIIKWDEQIVNPLYAGQEFWLRVLTEETHTNGNAFWFSVYCEAAEVLRTKLGLSRIPKIPFHYCIGYIREGKLNAGVD